MFDSLRPLLHRALFWHGAALRCLVALLPPDLLHRALFVSGSGTVANGLKGAFTQGNVSPPGGLVLKHGQRRQRCRKLAQGPNLPCGAKLPPASVKMHVAIPMLKIRRPNGRLIFNMEIAIPGKTVFLIETAPRLPLLGLLFWRWTH